jgi:hypothetical protein
LTGLSIGVIWKFINYSERFSDTTFLMNIFNEELVNIDINVNVILSVKIYFNTQVQH